MGFGFCLYTPPAGHLGAQRGTSCRLSDLPTSSHCCAFESVRVCEHVCACGVRVRVRMGTMSVCVCARVCVCMCVCARMHRLVSMLFLGTMSRQMRTSFFMPLGCFMNACAFKDMPSVSWRAPKHRKLVSQTCISSALTVGTALCLCLRLSASVCCSLSLSTAQSLSAAVLASAALPRACPLARTGPLIAHHLTGAAHALPASVGDVEASRLGRIAESLACCGVRSVHQCVCGT